MDAAERDTERRPPKGGSIDRELWLLAAATECSIIGQRYAHFD
jgi:hypothetical protein